MLADVRLEDAWGGPIDITGHRFPEIASSHGGRMHFAHGFAGNGVGPSRLAGRDPGGARRRRGSRSLAALPFVGRRQPFLPPEPFRFIGARMIREALIRRMTRSTPDGVRPDLADRALPAVRLRLGIPVSATRHAENR